MISSSRRAAAAAAAAGTTDHRRRWYLALLAGAALIAAGLAWYHGRPSAGKATTLADFIQPGAAAGYNVLLITLDTVRRDRIGCYGYQLAETPTCNALAAQGVVFDDAVTSVPLTLPSHSTIMTGLSPPHHGVRDNGTYRLGPEHTTLATTLKRHGYQTAAFVGSFVVDERFGLNQGFDVYDFQVTEEGYHPNNPDFNERPADAVTDAAVNWLDHRPAAGAVAPFFMWVHYFDAHRPYKSALVNEPRFAGRGYDAQIAFIDQNLGRLRAELQRLGIWQRTLVVLTSDHGEGLGEHKEQTHGMLLYEGTMRVPLIVSCAGLFQSPARIAGDVTGLVDVRPTIEDLLGLSPAEPCDGVSLLRIGPDSGRAIYLETLTPLRLAGWSPLYGLRVHGGKYILAPEPEYYDLQKDPGELHNLRHAPPAALAGLAPRLAQQLSVATSGPATARLISDEEARRLGSLGYMPGSSSEADASRDDPKNMMDVFQQASRCEELYQQGRYEEATVAAREVLAECAQCVQAQRVLAFSYLKLGQAAQAIDVLRKAVGQRKDTFLVRSLAQALILTRDFQQASETLSLYSSIDPTDGQVAILRGDILAQQQRPAEAISQYEEAIRIDKNRVGIMARQRIARLNGA